MIRLNEICMALQCCLLIVASFRISSKPIGPPATTLLEAQVINYDSINQRPVTSIALTREIQSNQQLRDMLQALLPVESCKIRDVPCIAFADGPDLRKLRHELSIADSVVLTSPRAAAGVISEWQSIGKPPIKFEVVGTGTAKILTAAGIRPSFEAVDMSAKGLARELPKSFSRKLLYPTSVIASTFLERSLREQGFHVTRLNIYDTVPYKWTELDYINARNTNIVTFASPSAARVWADRVGSHFSAVCLGPTTYKETKLLGFTHVSYCLTSKGIEPWVDLITSAVKEYQDDFLGPCFV